MVATIEEMARKLFEKGKSTREVFEILSKKGIKTSINTIRAYRKAWKRGFKSYRDFLKNWAKEKGFNSLYKYQVEIAKRQGFSGYYDYRTFLAKEKGFDSFPKYLEEWVKSKGYNTRTEYLEDLAKRQGCNSIYEYYLAKKGKKKKSTKLSKKKKSTNSASLYKDPYFLEIYLPTKTPKEDNPYLLMWKWLKFKDVGAREWLIENYLSNIENSKKLQYINKLRRGLKTLEKLGRI